MILQICGMTKHEIRLSKLTPTISWWLITKEKICSSEIDTDYYSRKANYKY